MTKEKRDASLSATQSGPTIDLAIRLGLLGLLGYWSFTLIAPFLTIALWSSILTVALYPLFDRLARHSGRRLAATLITLLCLLIVVGPVTWLGFGLVGGIGSLVQQLDTGAVSIPLPGEAVRSWPLIGETTHRLWTLAATNMKAALIELGPHLKPVAQTLVGIAQSVGLGLLEFVVSIIVAGFLFSPGPRLVAALVMFFRRVLSDRGEEMVRLAGTTIRNVSRGVVGIALLQSFLAGVGFLVARLPAAGILAFLALLLGIVQIGPGVLLIPVAAWSWTAMEMAGALIFTAYLILVSLVDNILKPIIVARGLNTPMLVTMIGVLGDTIAYGIVGLFFGPIVLSVAWALVEAWFRPESLSALGRVGSQLLVVPCRAHREAQARNG
jgi:predicted PurR-regulated permease PerM